MLISLSTLPDEQPASRWGKSPASVNSNAAVKVVSSRDHECTRLILSQSHSLQQGGKGRPLRCLGTAATLFRRGSRGLQITALVSAEWRRVRRARRLPIEQTATTENSKKVRRSESRNWLGLVTGISVQGPGKRPWSHAFP